jgi:hypothetical protein
VGGGGSAALLGWDNAAKPTSHPFVELWSDFAPVIIETEHHSTSTTAGHAPVAAQSSPSRLEQYPTSSHPAGLWRLFAGQQFMQHCVSTIPILLKKHQPWWAACCM